MLWPDFLFFQLRVIWTNAFKSCTHCHVPGAEDSKAMAPAIRKLAPMRVRPINREHYVKHGKYHNRSFQVVMEVQKRDISEESEKAA